MTSLLNKNADDVIVEQKCRSLLNKNADDVIVEQKCR